MPGKEKVIFDTNFIRSGDEHDSFFGNKSELKKFESVCEIIIPEICIEEIRSQKIRKLEEKKITFISHPFHKIFGLKKEDTNNFDSLSHVEAMELFDDLKYNIIYLTDNSVLFKIKELAINKQAPFEPGDNTDKGFKDAYIYFTVLEYLQSVPDKNIFVCTKDSKLKEAFNKHKNVICIEDFEEFKTESISSFFDEYFINKLKESVHETITKENIIDYWPNGNGNKILLIQIEGEKNMVEVEQREIISYIKYHLIEDNINNLIFSDNWTNTHSKCKDLLGYVKYIMPSDSKKLFEALIKNDQIYGTYGYSVQEFYKELFKMNNSFLEQDSLEELEKRFKLKNTHEV